MERLCKNCKHYAKADRVRGKNFGTCSCDKFVYTGDEHLPLEDDMLIYEDFEQYNAAFFVGENFGCIHFEERENG